MAKLKDNEKLKSVGSTMDFGFNFTDWLDEGISITNAEVVSEGLTITNVQVVEGVVTFYASGGTINTWYDVLCTITTDATPIPQVEEATMRIYVTQK